MSNLVEFLAEAELALDTPRVTCAGDRVAWARRDKARAFVDPSRFSTIEDYLGWLDNRDYSALLRDGSLLQISYNVEGGDVVKHRLAYVPCPFEIDEELLDVAPLREVVDLYLDKGIERVVMRSPIRFDFDLEAARDGHPASHLTVNAPSCRIACVAALHVGRFADLIYRSFYPRLWGVHQRYFQDLGQRRLGKAVIQDSDRDGIHIAWSAA